MFVKCTTPDSSVYVKMSARALGEASGSPTAIARITAAVVRDTRDIEFVRIAWGG
jgi:hypothetical protein